MKKNKAKVEHVINSLVFFRHLVEKFRKRLLLLAWFLSFYHMVSSARKLAMLEAVFGSGCA
jgi:hypothetical protein